MIFAMIYVADILSSYYFELPPPFRLMLMLLTIARRHIITISLDDYATEIIIGAAQTIT